MGVPTAIWETGLMGVIGAATMAISLRNHSDALFEQARDGLPGMAWADPVWIGLVFSLTLPYDCYAWIWYHPKEWTALCGKRDPVAVFATLCPCCKFVQMCLGFLWLDTVCSGGLTVALPAMFSAMPFGNYLVFAASVAAGQSLNGAVYAQIGDAGVYYGFKLGKTVPWCYGFPFNTGLRHPQYDGAVIGFWGVLNMVISEETVAAGILPLGIAITCMYMAIGLVEEIGDVDADADAGKSK
jgi:hypothetical protein